MGEIEWTGKRRWGFLRGCTHVSPGCENCYAEAIAERFSGVDRNDRRLPFYGYATRGKGWTKKVSLVREKLGEPLSWRDPELCFINSTSDLFHEALSFEEIGAAFGVMAQTPRHTYQVLTKRVKRARAFFEWAAGDGDPHAPAPDIVVTTMAVNLGVQVDQIQRPWPLPNVWLGASVEDQRRADERVSEFAKIPAAVRFLSCEPLLERVERVAMPGIDWIIVGGESGPGARPFELDWARDIVRECKRAGVPVFVKQLGAAASDPENGIAGARLKVGEPKLISLRLKSTKGNDMAEWPEALRVREMPRAYAGVHV